MKFVKSESGFTFVELLTVIAIVTLLASIAMVAYRSVQARERDESRSSDILKIFTALQNYYDKHGNYPCVDTRRASSQPSQFLPELVVDGAFGSVPLDPINHGPDSQYEYWSFEKTPDDACGQILFLGWYLETEAHECIQPGGFVSEHGNGRKYCRLFYPEPLPHCGIDATDGCLETTCYRNDLTVGSGCDSS